jgi:uncharacterized protein with PIN domain
MATETPKFIVDTMLGKLARWLRALGYDTLYLRAIADHRLLHLARAEARILLTRDARLAREAGSLALLVSAERLDGQISEVLERLDLAPPEHGLLSRCLECNGLLEDRPKDAVRGLVPEYIFSTQERFVGCPGCEKIYWQGSHADRILARLSPLLRRER